MTVPDIPPAFGALLAAIDGRDASDRAVQLVVTERHVLLLYADRRNIPFNHALEGFAPLRSLTVARLTAAETGWFGKVTALTVSVWVGREAFRVTAKADEARDFISVLASRL